MPAPALDSATDLSASLTADPRRARKQVITYSIVNAVLLLMALALLPLALSGNAVLGVIVGILALLVAFGVWVSTLLIRNGGRRLIGVCPRGVLVPVIADPIPWEDIAWLSAVRFSNRVSVGSAGRIAAGAMAAGGLNDGGRDINIVLKDAAAWRVKVGKTYEFLITDDLAWEQKGANGFNVNLATGSTAETFESFVLVLKSEADARGIPILISTR